MNKEKPIVKNKMIDLIQSCRFKCFVAEQEGRFEQEHGFFRPLIKEVADRIINHLKLTFFAERPRPRLPGTPSPILSSIDIRRRPIYYVLRWARGKLVRGHSLSRRSQNEKS